MNIPVFFYNPRRADEAYSAYKAVCQRERIEPALQDNPFWRALKRIAFLEFEHEFTKEGPQS
jgi:hypothetical protein